VNRNLGQVLGMIGNALQFDGDQQDGDDFAQIARQRLLSGNERVAAFLDLVAGATDSSRRSIEFQMCYAA